jgi:surfactin synthase thioesterase subunit
MTIRGRAARWINSADRSPAAVVILFCFPFSGGGAGVYQCWRQLMPPEIEVCPIHLPGRERRIGEPAEFSANMIASVLAEVIDLPYAVYGHSMGARLGFEVLRSLREAGAPAPVRFYPGASLPPDTTDPFTACAELPDEQFIDTLLGRLGAPAELRDVPELRAFQLPLLRHDMTWCHRYRYRLAAPLESTITAFAGEADEVATPEAMAGWSRHGQGGRVVILPDGHFFVRTCAPQLTSTLSEDLLSAVGVTGLPLPEFSSGSS